MKFQVAETVHELSKQQRNGNNEAQPTPLMCIYIDSGHLKKQLIPPKIFGNTKQVLLTVGQWPLKPSIPLQ